MSDLLDDIPPPPTVTIAGRPVPIAELSLYDRAELQRADRAAARKAVVADCEQIGATQAETYQELEAFRDRRWGDREWIALVNSTDGQVAVLEKGLELANEGRGRDLLAAVRWSNRERAQVVALVAGLTLTADAAGDETEGDPSDPPAGRPGPTTT